MWCEHTYLANYLLKYSLVCFIICLCVSSYRVLSCLLLGMNASWSVITNTLLYCCCIVIVIYIYICFRYSNCDSIHDGYSLSCSHLVTSCHRIRLLSWWPQPTKTRPGWTWKTTDRNPPRRSTRCLRTAPLLENNTLRDNVAPFKPQKKKKTSSKNGNNPSKIKLSKPKKKKRKKQLNNKKKLRHKCPVMNE